jgi:hypothetical protein
LVPAEQGEGAQTEELSYLARLRSTLPDGGKSLPGLIEHALQHPAEEDLPLLALASYYQLHWLEILSLALCLAVEQDAMVGRVLAFVQSPVLSSRPSLGLLEAALGLLLDDAEEGAPRQGRVGIFLLSGTAIEIGLLCAGNTSAPLPEQVLQLPPSVAIALGGSWQPLGGTALATPEEDIQLPDSITAEARRYASALTGTGRRALLLRSTSLPEGRAIVNLVARELDTLPLYVKSPQALNEPLGILAVIANLLPVIQLRQAALEGGRLPKLAGYEGPILVLGEPDDELSADSYALMDWLVPIPLAEERRRIWSHYLDDPTLARGLARDHRHSAGRIAELAGAADREAQVRQHKVSTIEDIRSAAWLHGGDQLVSLAVPVRDQIGDEALVLSSNTAADLVLLLERCRSRESLADGLGVSLTARYQPGVRALFTGPSGTGKTLAAAWLATRLAMPLYRVDLASVISKYVGETEKNLASLLSRAERSDLVLLFDEADSLFGKRTDIKDANDRYANTQTNYLLQRIESYQGIVLLTSNSRSRFDSAFSRRIDLIVEFPMPGPEERRTLWHSHLGSHHVLCAAQINQLSATLDICGGHIRNAVLAAAVLARKEEREIQYRDVLHGLKIEYRKLARKLPAELGR